MHALNLLSGPGQPLTCEKETQSEVEKGSMRTRMMRWEGREAVKERQTQETATVPNPEVWSVRFTIDWEEEAAPGGGGQSELFVTGFDH